MFTGIILTTGTVCHLHREGHDLRLGIEPQKNSPFFDSLVHGESIAVNGVCLSVEHFTPTSFFVYASEETLAHTTTGSLSLKACVNLERALRLCDRLGGHIVSGHVDAVAEIVSVQTQGLSKCIRIRFPGTLKAQVVDRGSVALDGVSLTVTSCTDEELTVNVIPDTQKNTTVSLWKPGTRLNLETDILGKYVERMLARPDKPEKSGLSMHFLQTHGYL